MFRKLSALTALFFLLMTFPVYATDISSLEGYTGKVGNEDVNWGTGQATDTFSVPTYAGGTTTLTKVPAVASDQASIVKGTWYVKVDAAITDHGDATQVGSLAWVAAQIAALNYRVVVPSAAGTLVIGTNLTLAANISLEIEKGAILSPSVGITLTINGPFHPTGKSQAFSGAGTTLFGTSALSGIPDPAWWGGGAAGAILANASVNPIVTVSGVTFSAADQAPAYLVSNAAPTTLANITSMVKGQTAVLHFANANTSLDLLSGNLRGGDYNNVATTYLILANDHVHISFDGTFVKCDIVRTQARDITIVDLSASRAFNTVYENDSGSPRTIMFYGGDDTATDTTFALYYGPANPPVAVLLGSTTGAVGSSACMTAVIPRNYFYKITTSAVTGAITKWYEAH